MRFSARLALVTLLTVGLAACEGSPVEAPEAGTFDEDVEFFLAESGAERDAAPAERVAAAVAHAQELLARANAAIGDSPSAEVGELLRRAAEACGFAQSALEAERWRRAAQAALRCAQGARMAVLEARTEARAGMEARAAAAIETAAGLVEEARALVGDDARDGAKAVLERAEAQLAFAERAFEAGRFREAAQRAHAAGTLAQRILRVLG